jgi:hypothetical protein
VVSRKEPHVGTCAGHHVGAHRGSRVLASRRVTYKNKGEGHMENFIDDLIELVLALVAWVICWVFPGLAGEGAIDAWSPLRG